MTLTFQTWEDQLDQNGPYASPEWLVKHLKKAPTPTNNNEKKTIKLVEKVIETRQAGGDITKIINH